MFEHSPSARTPERCRTTSYDCVALKLYKIKSLKKQNRKGGSEKGLASPGELSCRSVL